MSPDTKRMAEMIVDGRKDPLLIDAARLIAVHYGKMVEHFAAIENSPVSAHNNKTLFLEGLDIWSRVRFAGPGGAERVSDPRQIIEWIMKPNYEATALADPSQYRWKYRGEPPTYAGSPDDATATMLAMCAALDVSPIRIRLGIRDGKVQRAWGKVFADGKWYDSDINDQKLVLGEFQEFEEYQELEVPLEMEEEEAAA